MDVLCDTWHRVAWTCSVTHIAEWHWQLDILYEIVVYCIRENVSAEKLPVFTWLWMFPANYGLVNQQYKWTEMLQWKVYHEELFSTQNTKFSSADVFLCMVYIRVAGSGKFPFHSILFPYRFHTINLHPIPSYFHDISTLHMVTSYLHSVDQ